MLLGQTNKQPLSHFESQKSWKYNDLDGWDLTLVHHKKQRTADFVKQK